MSVRWITLRHLNRPVARALLLCCLLAMVPLCIASQVLFQVDKDRLLARTASVVDALSSQDGAALAALAHPQRGVRFSSSAYVDQEEDVVLGEAQLKTLWTDHDLRLWGYAEGSGDPIEMSPPAFVQDYLRIDDFGEESGVTVSINSDQAFGTTVNNAAKVYPQGARVEYFLASSGEPEDSAQDWAALRFVFTRYEEDWFLVAVIRDQWSP